MLFVTRATRQRVTKGAKRVSLIGVGKEKSQITVTLGVNEGTEKLLPTQYIFNGKTNKCHHPILPTAIWATLRIQTHIGSASR